MNMRKPLLAGTLLLWLVCITACSPPQSPPQSDTTNAAGVAKQDTRMTRYQDPRAGLKTSDPSIKAPAEHPPAGVR